MMCSFFHYSMKQNKTKIDHRNDLLLIAKIYSILINKQQVDYNGKNIVSQCL